MFLEKSLVGELQGIKIGANGQWLAVLISGSVWVCNLGAQNPELKKLSDGGKNFAMFGDPKEGRWLGAFAEESFQVWNTASWDKLLEQSASDTGSFREGLNDPKEGRWLAVLTNKGLFVWSSSWGEPRQLSDNTGFISFVVSEEGRWLVAYTNKSVLTWDTRSWLTGPKQLNGKIGFIEGVVTDPKGRWLAAVTDSGVFVWDSNSWGTEPKTLRSCPEGIYHIEFDTDDEGEWLAAYTYNKRLLALKSGLWNAEPRELKGHTGSFVQMICQQGWIGLITEKEGEEKARFTLWDRYHIDTEFVPGGDSGSP